LPGDLDNGLRAKRCPGCDDADCSIHGIAGAPARSIDLTAVFSDPDASNAVQMSVLLPSSTGFFNIALDGQHKPITVANFLNYVNSGDIL
jgi:Peptidyl-prolyl cis-trans isomerase (rotamase) - cyclophilin family